MVTPKSDVVGGSPGVTALAVVSFVLGGLRLALSGLLLWVAYGLFQSAGEAIEIPPAQQPVTDPGTLLITLANGVGVAAGSGLASLFLIGFGVLLAMLALVFILVSVLLVVAGRGLLRRRRWARRLTLVLASLGGLLAVLYLVELVGSLGDSSPTIRDVAIALIGLLVHGGYCALALVVLLNRRIAVEFV